jgi:bacterial/archaeal transporter family-2 protein
LLFEVNYRRDIDADGATIMSWLFAPFAALLGAVLTTQVATNALLGKALGNPYIPATVNMVIGFVATAILTWSLTSKWPSSEMMFDAPWYAWFGGGLMGVIYLTGTILLAPRLGAGALVGLIVAGQLIFSVVLDNFGWIGFQQHAASIPRLAGCALMLVGVFLISKF